MATLDYKLPYGHVVRIMSRCSAESIKYMKLLNIDGLNSSLSEINTQESALSEGDIYLGNTPQYKTLTFTFDVSDDNLLCDDFYRFFCKDDLLSIYFDGYYYVKGAITKIDLPLFGNSPQRATVVAECTTAYWMRNLIYGYSLSFTGGTGVLITPEIPEGLDRQEVDMTYEFTISNMVGVTAINITGTGVNLTIPIDISATVAGDGIVVFSPTTSSAVKVIYNGVTTTYNVTGWPDRSQKMSLGNSYAISLTQSSGNTVTAILNLTGVGRYYN